MDPFDSFKLFYVLYRHSVFWTKEQKMKYSKHSCIADIHVMNSDHTSRDDLVDLYPRVSIKLTVSRKVAQKLAAKRKNWQAFNYSSSKNWTIIFFFNNQCWFESFIILDCHVSCLACGTCGKKKRKLLYIDPSVTLSEITLVAWL